MEMFGVKIYSHSNKLLRVSLVQALTRDRAKREALNVYRNTPGAFRVELD